MNIKYKRIYKITASKHTRPKAKTVEAGTKQFVMYIEIIIHFFLFRRLPVATFQIPLGLWYNLVFRFLIQFLLLYSER